MASTIETYLLALTSTMGQGIVAAPISTASSGTNTSGTTETFDAVLGYYPCNLVAGRRYWAVMNGLHGGSTVTADLYNIRIRDSGTSSNPTSGSTLVASSSWYAPVSGGPGQTFIHVAGSFIAATSGTHTLGMSAVRFAGTGVFTPLSASSLARELYVVDLGVF